MLKRIQNENIEAFFVQEKVYWFDATDALLEGAMTGSLKSN